MIRVIGDSHAGWLAFARGGVPDGLTIDGNHGLNVAAMAVTRTDGGLRLFADRVPDMPALDIVLDAAAPVVFCGPFHTSPVARHPTWRTHCPWTVVAANPDLCAVSDAALAAAMAPRVTQGWAFLDLARELGIEVVVLEAPRLPRRAIAASGIRADVLAAVDRGCRAVVRRVLDERGTQVIDTPEETHDGAFLRLEFAMPDETDLHHGNGAYGALAIGTILDHFGIRTRARAS